MRYGRSLTAVLVCFLSINASALAQEGPDGGVLVDPDSPAGREYELPLDAARQDASGTPQPSDGASGGGRSAPLFGAGVGSRDGAASKAGGAREQNTTAVASGATSDSRGSGQAAANAETTKAAADGGLHSGVTIAVGAVLVLLAGGLIGLALRRPSAAG